MVVRSNVLAMEVNVLSFGEAIELIAQLMEAQSGKYVCVSNVHMCMETFDSPAFRSVVNQAYLVIPDGRPIVWAQRLLGYKHAAQVRGQDLMHALCEVSKEKGLKVGLYGGSSTELLSSVQDNLCLEHPHLNIGYAFSPPFRSLTPEEDIEVIEAINTSGVDILFVGIGCPKQEVWMANHNDRLNCVMLGVGAAFDFIAGSKKHAPRWMQHVGLEWLFRLCSEPKRLWKRYLKQNPRFVWYFLQQWWFGRHWD